MCAGWHDLPTLSWVTPGHFKWTIGSARGTLGLVEEIEISTFRATCLAALDRVRRTRKPVLVTRFGKPIARILPPPSSRDGEWLGAMQGDGEILDDLVTPAVDLPEWEVLK